MTWEALPIDWPTFFAILRGEQPCPSDAADPHSLRFHEPRCPVVADQSPLQVRLNALSGLCDWWRGIGRVEKCVEIGAYRGVSTQVHAAFAARTFAVDPWAPEEWRRFLARGIPGVTALRERSETAHLHFEDYSLDVIYHDADHSYAALKRDFGLWNRKVKIGGYIGGHDYSEQHPDVIRAVDETFGKPTVFSDTSWRVRL